MHITIKRSQVNYHLIKEKAWQIVRKNVKATGESTKTQSRYRGSMFVTEILPSDKYRISQLEPSNGRLYAKTAHVSQLKAWKCWNEDDETPVQILMMDQKCKDSNKLYVNQCVMELL
ncbi:hypothetical protein AVEN_154975-1 [Araneus ventricosus]|uniref:Uncharacterized protein n=1 Tax=Araneus ventricosus TaxID=182803 RepID=A0A4Y2A751_ARAVE|nr:hypothetical protein AVEN_154975-1 [Araneus ventricosus]